MALTFYKHDAIQSVHNIDDLPMIFKEKFSYMAITFGVISITCCTLSAVIIFYGERLNLHQVRSYDLRKFVEF